MQAWIFFVGGGVGPDIWDDEIQVEANDFLEAMDKFRKHYGVGEDFCTVSELNIMGVIQGDLLEDLQVAGPQ